MSGKGEEGTYDQSRKVTYDAVIRVSDERDAYNADDVQVAIERALTRADRWAWTGKLFWGGWKVVSVTEVPAEIEWRQVAEREVAGLGVKGIEALPAVWTALGGALRVEEHPLSIGKFLAIVTLDGQGRRSPGVFPTLEMAQREAETAWRNWKSA